MKYKYSISLLMTALTAKVIAMGLLGQPIIPVVFIIPSLPLFRLFVLIY